MDEEKKAEVTKQIDDAYRGKESLTKQELEVITTKVFALPKFFNTLLFEKLTKKYASEKLKKLDLLKSWNNEFERIEIPRRLFLILSGNGQYIRGEDFKPLMRVLLDTHPGLEFLQATPEF